MDRRKMAFRSCILLLFVFLTFQQTHAQKRVALLIGNEAYTPEVGRLKNPVNDVNLIASSLRQIGFRKDDIEIIKNADRIELLAAVDRYASKLANANNKAIGFFYYSGHGAANKQNQRNYLIPVGVKKLDTQVWYKSVALSDVVSSLANRAGNAAHFVIFDACRNLLNAPSRGGKGFVPVAERRGLLIAYSTDPGETASDAGDKSGPYAAGIAAELIKPGLDHLDLFQNVKERVYRETGGQLPWTRDGLIKRVYLNSRDRARQTSPSSRFGTEHYDVAARKRFEKASAKKDSRAMFELGFMYDKGLGGAQDDVKAREWYLKSAEGGNVDAMRNLAIFLRAARGGPRDDNQARSWFKKAAGGK